MEVGDVVGDAEDASLQGTPTADERRLRRRWSQLIKRVLEVDPLVCPSCGGEMRIIAFIVDHPVVDAILRHLAGRSRAGRVRGPPDAAHLEVAL